MDQITYSYTSSSSSSSDNRPPKNVKSRRAPYIDSLHSVRKPVQKPITKHFIAPLPPAPSKVYKVESSKFKEVVRMLTSTPEFQPPSVRRLKDIAPPPLTLSAIPKPSIFPKPPLIPPPQPPPQPSEGEGTVSPLSSMTLSPGFCKFLNETLETSRFVSNAPVMDCFGSLSPLRSPAPQAYDPLGVALMSPLGFSLSPSSLSWCSSALLSPVSLSVFN
ncbi:putative VQ motif-containing protein [Helianthus annuus]|uniref:protein EARLY FLOWERING 5-like n=1 Tax=Helianthus annuus TaxID=4232 RepID=UPI000B8F9BD7|nr:protein EARLY FLOWERING 5-like [Helianthus annuus]KAJ0535107.1 putative VQ motif-containing protein [Helianthus annuus]